MPYDGYLEWRLQGSTVVVAGAGAMPQDAVEHLITDVERHWVKRVVAVATGRVQMTSVQRRLVATAFRRIPVAAIVEDRLTYGLVTAIAWLGTAIRAFQPSDIESALDYVGVALGDRDWTRLALADLSKLREPRRHHL